MHEPKNETGEFVVAAGGLWLHRLEDGALCTVNGVGAATDFGSHDAAEAAIEAYRAQGRHKARRWTVMRIG